MRTRCSHAVILMVVAALLLAPATASARIWNDLAFALGYAGFNIAGDRNVLSGGNDYIINTQFRGNPLDFGVFELTLQGPISAQMSTGGRFVDELEFHFQTALSDGQASTPLSYNLTCDACGQATEVAGSVLVDGDLIVNELGCYSFQLEYSSRQDVTQDGLVDGEFTNDFDIGPINVQGNIYFDLIALVLDPLFTAAGAENPFKALSGFAAMGAGLGTMSGVQDTLMTELTQVGVDELIQATLADQSMARRFSTENQSVDPESGYRIPEPTSLLLLGVGATVLTLRRRC